jgi:hypothetical protein
MNPNEYPKLKEKKREKKIHINSQLVRAGLSSES